MFLRHRLRIALLLFGCLTLLAGCHKNTSSQPSAGGTLQSIDIVAFPLTTIGQASLSLAQGGVQPFVATGYYSDGSTQDLTYEVTWQADNPAVASISQNGELTGVEAGVVSVTASKNGIISNAVVVEITRARIITVAVTPSPVVVSKGQPVSMQAIATYDDGSQADITRIATWRLDNPVVATITPDGVVTGREVGTSGVTASKQGVVSDPVFVEVTSATLDAITITSPSVTLAKGQRRQLQATAIYSDGTQADLTRFATWQSDNMASAVMLPFGVVKGVASGNARVTARFAGVSSGGTAIKVTAAQLTKLNVTPPSVTLAKGLRQSMRAIGTYSDNTQADLTRFVAWRSNNNNVAWVGPDGLLIAASEGAASINASMEGVTSNAGAVQVTSAVITKLTVSPSPVKIAKGQSSSLRVIATYSDNSQVDITRLAAWRVDDYGVASITVDGAVRGREVGTTTVTSTKDGITSDPVNVDVTSAVITKITVEPATVTVPIGAPLQLTAMATYSDNTSSDVTRWVSWLTLDGTIAQVANGLVSGVKVGTTTVRAGVTVNGSSVFSNAVTVNVCELAGVCIDIFDTGSGKLFTNSPSVAYLDSIGSGGETNGILTEDGNYGPTGNFYLFNWQNANALCATYNINNLGGRTNWRLPTADELKVELYAAYGNMFTARSWPTKYGYRSQTPDGPDFYTGVVLFSGITGPMGAYSGYYVSCVSEP
ncbi:Ig-like domain-containing protein [Aeromonas veronii]|uniref:Ig-like domain-containing protein n=1 Tax=Aeromonas veronii TaxID=654 RepID=UPI00111AE2EA|nr:Ig-like domain-containing protein [Aeromonas veronii]TNI15022.1 hypothetical protein CF106_01420 [Aeromonas veronii]